MKKVDHVCRVTLAMFFLALAFACGGGGDSSRTTPASPPKSSPSSSAPTVTSISASPSAVTLAVGATQQFTAVLQGKGKFNPAVNWLVNQTPGGNSTVGTISATGLYTAPATIATNPLSVTIEAVSVQVPTKSASANVSLHTSTQSVIPQSRVAVIVFENASYSDIVGSANMPYLNSVISRYGLATNYFANAHGSIGDYFMLTTGKIITDNWLFEGVISDDNLVREIANSGKSWKAYAESIPSAGYLGPTQFPYYRIHVPFVYFSDVVNDSARALNIVPFTQLATDLQNNMLPDLLFIVPNEINDMHSCRKPGCKLGDRERVSDTWLSTNIKPLLQDADFQSSGLLIITFDEASNTDSRHGGGQVACVLASANIKPGYRSTVFYQHQDVLALVGKALRLGTIPGAGATADPMKEFFQ
jgi:hypothetical protein